MSQILITADSEPVYDTLWNTSDPWQCPHWILWHKKMKQTYGIEYANEKWQAAWSHPDNYDAFWVDTVYCRYDCNFVEYFYKEGIPIGNIVSNTYCDLEEVVENVSTSINWVSKLLPVALVGGLAYVGYQAYKNR